MIQEKSCQSETHNKAQKICISPQCKVNSPLICQSCEQLHDHNGTILAVRINKVKQICVKKQTDRKTRSELRTQLTKIKEGICERVDKILKQIDQGIKQGDNQNINQQLDDFIQGRKNENFAQVWEKTKSQMTNITNKQYKNIEQYKKQLRSVIEPADNNQQLSRKTSEFLSQLSMIFSYQTTQLKTKQSSSTLQQIRNLKAQTRQEKLILAKLSQLTHQYDHAIKIYEQMLKQNPIDTEIITFKALVLRKCKKYKQADQQFSNLIQLIGDKANTEYYRFCKGEVLRMMGKYEEALKQYAKCKQKQKNQDDKLGLNRSMGLIFYKLNKYQQAIQLLKSALKSGNLKQQQQQQVYEAMYECAKNTSDNNLALQALNKLYSKTSNIQILFKRARIHHQLKLYQSAVDDYTLAIEKAKDIPGLYYNRAVQIIYLGKSQQSISDLKKAIQLDPNFKQAIHLLASTCFDLFQKGSMPQAAEQLKILAINSYSYSLKFYKQNQSIWHNLGVLETQKNPQKAYECFENALKINPKLNASYLGKIKTGSILHKDPKIMLNDVNVLINLGDRSVSTFLIKCAYQDKLGLYKQAHETIALILKADPQNQQALQLQKIIQSKQNNNNYQTQQAQTKINQ